MNRLLRLSVLTALSTVVATLAVPATAVSRSIGFDDPAATARHRLTADASGRVLVEQDASGDVRFVGVAARGSLDNPAVARGSSVAAAARAHLDRYGAALGASQGTSFVRRSTTRAQSGVDVVAYTQELGGVPVIGGDVVVSLGPDRQLRSLASSVSGAEAPAAATVPEATAAGTARGVVERATRVHGLDVTALGRGLLDPAVVEVSMPAGARSVWQFEVGDHTGVRQQVLVDDHAGRVLLRADLIEHADRVVCDRQNVRGSDTTCTSGFARAEGDPESVVADVNSAYDLSGAVASFYQEVAGADLTQLLGVDVGGVKKLASTVRFCTSTKSNGVDFDDPCPYGNAFWNGQQMFYGAGWASADDVVGHEMTHGFVDQYSRLFYWGQSGAINESVADVIGEIVDHRHASTGDTAGDWRLGEDSPLGTLRSLSNPTLYGQPDRMTSNLYDPDTGYADNGGVHTNSGVGNKTAYLISQGGSFNGQTITGIDGGDPTLTATATLYVDVIERLSSGADFAALAAQLDQSCQDLLALGTAGFTAADCTAVHQAGVATELTANPPTAAHPTDASTACPAGTTKRVLLDGETDPTATFAPVDTGWTRASGAGTSNATSGTESWYAEDPGGSSPSTAWIETNPLRASVGTPIPAGQRTFLAFENWYVLDYDSAGYYDGGTVELGVDGGVPALGSTKGGTWVNGPNRTLASGYGNTAAGQPAYSGDSHGWSVSRLELTQYAGHTVKPQFTMRSDNQYGFIGWYLDDITIYTCDVPPAPRNVRVLGALNAMTLTWQPPASGADEVDHYVVDGPRGLVEVGASTTSYSLPIPAALAGFQVRVVAVSTLGVATSSGFVTVRHIAPSFKARRFDARVRFKGAVVASAPVVGGVVRIQRRTSTGWTTVSSVRTSSDGTYVTRVRHRKRAYYRALYLGGVNLVGMASVTRRQ